MSGYGYSILDQEVNPCDYPGLSGLCPMIAGNLPDLQSNTSISSDQINKIPSKDD
jgi:ML-like domain